MQRRTDVVETQQHRKVRRPYATYILNDTQMIKIIRHSFASDTLWIRKVCHKKKKKKKKNIVYFVSIGLLALEHDIYK